MSNLQFRAWNKNNNTMVDLKKITPFALHPDLKQDGVFIPFNDDFVVMQSTGVTDAEGVLMFDGDILEFNPKSSRGKLIRRRKHYVFWDTVKLRWMMMIIPKIDGLPEKCPLHVRVSEMNTMGNGTYTIIGNVHANPELLEG